MDKEIALSPQGLQAAFGHANMKAEVTCGYTNPYHFVSKSKFKLASRQCTPTIFLSIFTYLKHCPIQANTPTQLFLLVTQRQQNEYVPVRCVRTMPDGLFYSSMKSASKGRSYTTA